MPAVYAGAALMAASLFLGVPYWFAGCFLLGVGAGVLRTGRGGDRR